MTVPVCYHLGKFPPTTLQWERLIPLIGSANRSLASYNALLSAIPNADVLFSPLTTQEAVLSSKIEGTNVTMGEVLELEAGGDPDGLTQSRRDDVEEVLNYRRALRNSVAELRERDFSMQILRQAHQILMDGVRGKTRSPGRVRTSQNWIGDSGRPVEEAKFIPIAPEHLVSGLEGWVRFFNGSQVPDPLVQLAIVHLEFEALHPFEDGNGRLGRMLIPLFLFKKGLISSPDFYMSEYLETNRESYQQTMRDVSRLDRWTEWCIFFLEGIAGQSGANEAKARSILNLYQQIKENVVEWTRSQHSIRAVDFLFQVPIFPSSDFIELSGIPKPTANRILAELREHGLLATIREGKGRRAGIYAFRDLLNIAEGRAVL